MWFVKTIFQGKSDEKVHSQFVRFSKGLFPKRFAINYRISKDNIKIGSSFENANDLILKAAEALGKIKVNGKVLCKDASLSGKKKANLFETEIDREISYNEMKEIYEKCYFMLLNSDSEIKIKCKTKLPKPGKSGDAKVDDKFIVLEMPLKLFNLFKEEFFWDCEGNKCFVEHDINITGIDIPKVDNPEQMRLLAKKKGILIRRVNDKMSEKSFVA